MTRTNILREYFVVVLSIKFCYENKYDCDDILIVLFMFMMYLFVVTRYLIGFTGSLKEEYQKETQIFMEIFILVVFETGALLINVQRFTKIIDERINVVIKI